MLRLSIVQNPEISSFDSANGPSTVRRFPLLSGIRFASREGLNASPWAKIPLARSSVMSFPSAARICKEGRVPTTCGSAFQTSM